MSRSAAIPTKTRGRTKTPRLRTLEARRSPLTDPPQQRAILDALPTVCDFEEKLDQAQVFPIRSRKIDVLQINVGKVCNQACRHCHVDAGPDRRESMDRETVDACLSFLERSDIQTVDITGGAPELNPHFRDLVRGARALGRHVIDRCNLTILETGAHRDLPELLAEEGVEIVCSLPHYRALNTDRQRGEGVYEKSIRALRRLNALGYGDGRSGLRLVLVTNPAGAYLPGDQASLEREWKRELDRLHGVRFDALYTITNMPISRYLEWLSSSGNLERYMEKLLNAFNPAAVEGLMCRSTLSVGWDGTLYDCDFNQMLEMPVRSEGRSIFDLEAGALEGRPIAVGRHCYGCTAGAGSSCGGQTTGS